jgi:hypothetical protein
MTRGDVVVLHAVFDLSWRGAKSGPWKAPGNELTTSSAHWVTACHLSNKAKPPWSGDVRAASRRGQLARRLTPPDSPAGSDNQACWASGV